MNVIRRFFGGRPHKETIGNRKVWFYTRYGNVENVISEYRNENSFLLAKSLSEIYNPIDIIADRVSSVKYELVEKVSGNVVNKPKRLLALEERVNAIQDFSSFIHDLTFTMLAQGGVDVYRNKGGVRSKDIAFINSLWVLNPINSVYNYSKTVPRNPFDITNLSEVITSVETTFVNQHTIQAEDIVFSADNGFSFSDLQYISPLNAAEKNINNLLMVYQARYNQYKNNGAAGILTPKQHANTEFSQFEPSERQDIIDEMNMKDGVIDGKNFIGVSGIPLEFIKTIGTIKELMPFEETLENQIKIAGVYNVDKELLPKKDSTTFSNKKDAEKFLWQNTIKPYCYKVATILNELLYIPQNQTLKPIFDEVEVLQEDREVSLKADLLELQVIEKLREMGINSKDLESRWK